MATFTFCLLISVVAVFYVQVEGQEIVRRQCPDTAAAPRTACNCDDARSSFGSTCLNGGICMSNNLEGFSCLCPAAATGAQCQNTPDAQCKGSGECNGIANSECVRFGRGRVCTCSLGFVRTVNRAGRQRCVKARNECRARKPVCRNGGRCIDLPILFRCVCAPGFEGRRCTKRSGTGEDSSSVDSASSDSDSVASVGSMESSDSDSGMVLAG